jgi:hypothetical protein
VAGLAAFGLAFAGMIVGSLIGQTAGKCVPLHAPQDTPGTIEETRP